MRNPTEFGIARRSFLTQTLGTAAAVTATPWWRAFAGPFEGPEFEHLVPSDKRLSPSWRRSLLERGEATVNQGADLRWIGMPVGGIGCGQLYLGGDGRLWHWDIFNQPPPPDASDYRGPHYANPLTPSSPIEQGFAIQVTAAGRQTVHRLDATGFPEVRFRGEYPVGRVDYRGQGPVEVTLEAFSPFIPLDEAHSSLPITVMEFTVRNTGSEPVDVALAGWLENAVCLGSGTPGRGERTNRFRRHDDLTFLDGRALGAAEAPGAPPRTDVLFDDFERAAYEPWTATGTAFGRGPVEADAMPEYQGKVSAVGSRLVNSHASAPATDVGARDAAVGTLTSRAFVVERDYINFLIGGGAHRGKTCLNLVVDGRVVLSATGENNNQLRPRSWDVRAWQGRTARLELVDAEPGPWGNIGLDEVVFSDTPSVARIPLDREEDWGSLGLGLLGRSEGDFGIRSVGDGELPQAAFGIDGAAWPAVGDTGEAIQEPFGRRLVGALGRRMTLPAGSEATVTFLVSWWFPAVRRGALAHVTGIESLRREYARRFASAHDVARYVARAFPKLAGGTRQWRKTWYDTSTLPHWFLERTFVNISTLATATCHWFDNGRFYGWEGTYCCAGTCQHVWQYAQAVGRVFPSLERSVREQVDYGLAFHGDTGAIDYRAEAHRVVAIDGQTGTILRVYREHLMSADDAFLRRLWPRVRKSIEHLMARDANEDGVLDGEQYNTLDASWWGEIAWLSSMYVAALRAGAAMAGEVGDSGFAARCTAQADRGMQSIAGRLFNGEYFVHRVDPGHPEAINTNDGCHIDQVYGQSWAWQVGLPRVLPEEPTRQALASLWRYNVTPDVGVYRDRFKALRGGRWYAMPGEGGLLMCTWPKGGAERAAGKGDPTFVGYFNECMTGFEYQVASHMIWEGMVEEGLAVTRMIHDRYSASRRNPFNEVECSSHYARAMASHGVYLAACGFGYHGPRGELTFVPRWNRTRFIAAFIGAEGWGTLSQVVEGGQRTAEVTLAWGRLRLREWTLDWMGNGDPGATRVTMGDRVLAATAVASGGRLRVRLEAPVDLNDGDVLRVVSA